MTTKRRKTPRWTYSAGERGTNRVRVYDRGTRGIYLDYFDVDGKRVRTPLGHSDRDRAKGQADDLAAKFRQQAARPARLTLAKLFDIYEREVSRHKRSASKRKHDARCKEMFLRFLGRDRDPRTLSRREWDRLIVARRDGTLRPKGVKEKRAVGDRVIEYDLKYLLGVLNWGTVAGDGKGAAFLDRNPLKGMPLPAEKNPKRAMLDDDQYDAMLGAAGQVDSVMRPLLVVTHETGHRIGSIRQLQWPDIDLDDATVTWRAETDKEGRAHTTPLTLAAVAALTTLGRTQGGPTLWVFPSPKNIDQACSRNLVRDWWERCAKIAKLPKGERYGWHSVRRAWASAMRDVSPRDLADLGGWASYETPFKCYIRPSLEAQRGAFAQRRELRAPKRTSEPEQVQPLVAQEGVA